MSEGQLELNAARYASESNARRRWRVYGGSPLAYWAANLLLLALVAAVLFFDKRMDAVLAAEESWTELTRVSATGPFLAAACGLGLASLLVLGAGMWLGSAKFRQLKSLGVLVALIGCWLGCAMNCESVAWHGRLWRMTPYVAFFERCATPLERQWPAQDGELPEIGPFMAYPAGRPRTLILLTPPEVFEGGPVVHAIERADDGALRFELSDREGDWVERRESGPPESHIGGLSEQRQLTRASSLAGGWYLTHYRDK